MNDTDYGGDPACWAHLFEDEATEPPEEHVDDGSPSSLGPLVVDLGVVPSGAGGAMWSLPHGGDLDANLVRLDPHTEIGAHVNNEVDVLVFVNAGAGAVQIDGKKQPVDIDHLVLIPKGARRSIAAGPMGITYLSIHRRRGPLGISQRTKGTSS